MKASLALALVFVGLSVSFSVMAGPKKAHRHHEAHEHGAATLSIAFDQMKGKIEFKAAAAGVLGFEHQAKSDKDKKALSDLIAKFQSGIGSMIKFEEPAACLFTVEKNEMVPEGENTQKSKDGKKSPHHDERHGEHSGEHSDFMAQYSVECKNNIKGTKLTLDFTSFKGLKDLDVTILIDDFQKSIEVKGKPVTVELR